MKIIRILIVISLIASPVLAQEPLFESGWKGIKVFRSNRADVERVFGKPIKEENGEVRYETDDAYISVLFSNGACRAPDTLLGGFNVKEGTVLEYEVRPKKLITVGDLRIDLTFYKRVEDPEVLQFTHYYNDRAGIFLSALKMSDFKKEIVRTIYFQRTPEQVVKFGCENRLRKFSQVSLNPVN